MTDNHNKTTAEHFEIFKAECRKWVDFFGLKGWKIVYTHKEVAKDSELANIAYNMEGRVASINLEPEWPDYVEATEFEIRRCAFHEVGELLLGRLNHIATARYCQPEEVGEEVHSLIRTLENVIWEPAQRPSGKIISGTIDGSRIGAQPGGITFFKNGVSEI